MSSPFDLDRAVEALRVEHDDGLSDDADATRWRIRESLDRARVVRSRLIATLVVCGVLSTGGVSWAYLSGRLEGVWPWLTHIVGGQRVVEPARPAKKQKPDAARVAAVEPSSNSSIEPSIEPPVAPPVGLEVASAEPPRAELEPVRQLPAPPVAIAKVPPAAPAAPRARPPTVDPSVDRTGDRASDRTVAAAVDPLLAAKPASPAITASAPVAAVEPPLAAAPDLYRVAHQLHFHGADPAAAVAAWDKYLASESSGRFAVEARYNRAMALIRLRRYREAHIALDPFARGEVAPAGYRQTEAKQLSQRLERLILGDKAAQPEKPAP